MTGYLTVNTKNLCDLSYAIKFWLLMSMVIFKNYNPCHRLSRSKGCVNTVCTVCSIIKVCSEKGLLTKHSAMKVKSQIFISVSMVPDCGYKKFDEHSPGQVDYPSQYRGLCRVDWEITLSFAWRSTCSRTMYVVGTTEWWSILVVLVGRLYFPFLFNTLFPPVALKLPY